MDPDLMLGSAGLGVFHNPRWNRSDASVYTASGVRFNDGGPESEPLRRMGRCESQGMELADEAADAGFGRRRSGGVVVMRDGGQEQISSSKRRWSTRLSETLVDLGKTVKMRTDSWSWRRDSLAPVQGLEAPASRGGSSVRLPGSGERSRDGGDEMSGDDGLLVRSVASQGRSTALQPLQRIIDVPPRVSSLQQTVSHAVEHTEYRYPAPEYSDAHRHEYMTCEGDSDSQEERFEAEMEARRWIRHTAHERLMMMERQLRIAEREGAFTATGRKAMFKRSHIRQRRTSEQSQASVKLKKKIAKRQKKSDKEFKRWLNGDDVPWHSRLWTKMTRRWSRSSEKSPLQADLAEQDLPGDSGFESGESGESSGSTSGNYTDSDDEWRGDDWEASRYVGWALQSAPTIF